MAKEAGKKLPLWKRVGGFALIALALLGGLILGMLPSGLLSSPGHGGDIDKPSDETGRSNASAVAIVMGVLGFISLGAGIGLYFLTLASRCFFSDFKKPFWNAVKGRMFLVNIVVLIMTGLGLACLACIPSVPILMMFGLPLSVAVMIPVLGTFIILQFVTVWLNVWQPLEKSTILARLKARGVTDDYFERGIYLGVSDPSRSSMKKIGMVEDDMGMLWVGEKEIVYMGDMEDFRIAPEQFVEMQRVADAGSVSALFGNVHVILKFRARAGGEITRRLHTEGIWTMSGKARASDMLAEKIAAWQQWHMQHSHQG
jgi:hypothetical protein